MSFVVRHEYDTPIWQLCNTKFDNNNTKIRTAACTASQEFWLTNTTHHSSRCLFSWHDLSNGHHFYYYTAIRGLLYTESDTYLQAPEKLRFVFSKNIVTRFYPVFSPILEEYLGIPKFWWSSYLARMHAVNLTFYVICWHQWLSVVSAIRIFI